MFKSRIQAYSVHESPNAPADRDDRAEALVFVRDGFSTAAFLFAPIWMLTKRAWISLLFYVAAGVALFVVVGILGTDPRWIGYGFLLLHAIVGFEADEIERSALERRGFRFIASVTGTTYEDCERRFFESWLRTVPAVSTGNFTPPGTRGGLSMAGDHATPPPYTGDVMPPKRTGWRQTMFGSK